jgi:hypothetical protein
MVLIVLRIGRVEAQPRLEVGHGLVEPTLLPMAYAPVEVEQRLVGVDPDPFVEVGLRPLVLALAEVSWRPSFRPRGESRKVRVHGPKATFLQKRTRCSSMKADPAARGPEATPEDAAVLAR